MIQKVNSMKKKNWIFVFLIILCLAGFYAYRAMDLMRTDTKAPVIKISEEALEVSVSEPRSALLNGVTATDNRDGNVTASIVVEHVSLLDTDGRISVSYAAFDSSGNVSKATREAKFTDYQRPRFYLENPLIYTNANFDVLGAVSAHDILDGDIQHRIRASSLSRESIAVEGIHEVEFSVSNSLGDTVSYVFPVEVIPADQYNAKLSLKEYLIYLPVGANFVPGNYLDTFTIRNEETILSNGLPSNYHLQVGNTVNTSEPGVYTVSYKVTYIVRNENNMEVNQEYTAYSKLIVVVEG